MVAPKGHKPYPGCEKGGAFGYLGKGDDYYKDSELQSLGEGLVKWIQEKNNIWLKYYFSTKCISWDTVMRLGERSPMFKQYLIIAKEIQESKLCTEPYFRRADGNHARFMLARHHKGDWADKNNVQESANTMTPQQVTEHAKNQEKISE